MLWPVGHPLQTFQNHKPGSLNQVSANLTYGSEGENDV